MVLAHVGLKRIVQFLNENYYFTVGYVLQLQTVGIAMGLTLLHLIFIYIAMNPNIYFKSNKIK